METRTPAQSNLGEYIRAERVARGWTMDQMVKVTREQGLYVPKSQISTIENGRRTNPTYTTLKSIASAFGMSLSQMIDEVERFDCDEGEIITDYTREQLIAICELAIVQEGNWSDRDSASAHIGVGTVWALLNAGCAFRVMNDVKDGGLATDRDTIWLEITYRGFAYFDYGDETDESLSTDTFYLPTMRRLKQSGEKDWY